MGVSKAVFRLGTWVQQVKRSTRPAYRIFSSIFSFFQLLTAVMSHPKLSGLPCSSQMWLAPSHTYLVVGFSSQREPGMFAELVSRDPLNVLSCHAAQISLELPHFSCLCILIAEKLWVDLDCVCVCVSVCMIKIHCMKRKHFSGALNCYKNSTW